MDTLIAPKVHEVTKAANFLPAVSIIMPFEPKIRPKNVLNHSLRLAINKVEWELHQNYSGEMAQLLMQKLKSVLCNLNYSTHTISMAIYVSPVFERVLYLNIPVEEKIVVGESFDILDLAYSKKELRKYIVLLLSNKECRMYLGNSENLVKILYNTPQSAYAYINQASTRFANFPELSNGEELTDEFLRYNDNVLDIILNSYHHPLFVIGNEKIVGQFKNLTKHSSFVIEYVQGNYDEASLEQIEEIVAPYIADWKKVKQKDLSNQLKEAAVRKKLAFGINNVWREGMNCGGHLLMLGKDYMYTLESRNISNIIYKAVKPYSKFSYIKNQLGELVEKILKNGGDVELVDKEVLLCYDHIALIK